jgi:UDP-N-acetylmuramoyl-tripeptide--D-alanyl-D-alanine ligase
MNIKELYSIYKQHPCITTDSRNCPKDSIFLALKGETFDGNQYAAQALEKGCAYAIVDNPQVVDGSRYILVQDCLQTFKDLAREHRRQFSIPVIGITGTNGKTTTKELIAAVLGEKFNVLYTEGNQPEKVTVPSFLGCAAYEANSVALQAGLNVSYSGAVSSGGVAVAQSIAEGAEVARGTVVSVTFAANTSDGNSD